MKIVRHENRCEVVYTPHQQLRRLSCCCVPFFAFSTNFLTRACAVNLTFKTSKSAAPGDDPRRTYDDEPPPSVEVPDCATAYASASFRISASSVSELAATMATVPPDPPPVIFAPPNPRSTARFTRRSVAALPSPTLEYERLRWPLSPAYCTKDVLFEKGTDVWLGKE